MHASTCMHADLGGQAPQGGLQAPRGAVAALGQSSWCEQQPPASPAQVPSEHVST